ETVTLNSANRFEVTLEDLEPGDYTVTEIGPSPEPKTILYSAEGGAVVVAEGQGAAVAITHTYGDGPAPRVDLGESCEAGIAGTLLNDDGDLSVTFTVTIDGEESDVLVEAGKSVTLDIPETATSVTVTAPGMEDA